MAITIGWILLPVLLLAPMIESSRILVVFPMSSQSHTILGNGVVNNLLKAGHEVVYITSIPRDESIPKLTEINVGSIMENLIEEYGAMDAVKLKNVIKHSNAGDSLTFLLFAKQFQERVIMHENVTKIISDPKEKFDAVVIEWFFNNAIAGIAPLLGCPLLWLGSTEAHWQTIELVDEATNPAYSVDVFSTSSPPLNFFERIEELWRFFRRYTFVHLIVIPLESWFYKAVMVDLATKKGVTIPSYYEATSSGSILFLNSHPSIGIPYRLPQSAKYIGGYHIDEKVKPLPKDIQNWMDKAKDGVIYFSMGSNLKSADMSDEMRESLLTMFSKVKQTVIWKFEEELTNVPPNVKLVKWAPQQSILAHPNLKIFITHGGQLSTTEAIHFAIPVIGLPVMADQYLNMKTVQHKGYGIFVKISEDVADLLFNAIQEMLTNPSYKKRAEELSFIYHDRPVPPGRELVHWVEHVIRTGGAPHLRSPALDVPLYQKMYLDLAAVVAIIFAALYFVIKMFRRKSSKANKQKRS